MATRWRPSSAVQAAMREVDPDQGTAEIVSMEQLLAGSIAGPRLQTILLGAFGALGLVLACIGVYAVISYSVAQRMREMGIRLRAGRGAECHPRTGASRGDVAGAGGRRSGRARRRSRSRAISRRCSTP